MISTKHIIPTKFKVLNRLNDLVFKLTINEQKIQMELIEAACLSTRTKALDLGCGTGELSILIKEKKQSSF